MDWNVISSKLDKMKVSMGRIQKIIAIIENDMHIEGEKVSTTQKNNLRVKALAELQKIRDEMSAIDTNLGT